MEYNGNPRPSWLMLDVSDRFVRLCGEVGNFTERTTGVSIVDAYFGPDRCSPSKQPHDRDPEMVLSELGVLQDEIAGQVEPRLRGEYLLGEAGSIEAVMRWLFRDDLSYLKLVRTLFKISARKFSEKAINKMVEAVDQSLSWVEGSTLLERVRRFTQEGEVSGEALKTVIDSELQPMSYKIASSFQDRVYSLFQGAVIDNGVSYETARDQPWSGYNYYKGDFKSVNQFNIDRKLNRDSLLSVAYHEYEHHVANLWREKAYLENGYLELAIVPLHTGRSVISEGSADSARDFLGVNDNSSRTAAYDLLYRLRRMVAINTAIMMNHEDCSTGEAESYSAEKGLRTREDARSSLSFISPKTSDGRTNIWAPYCFTYLIGRTDYVEPTFTRAKEKGKLAEFFRTLYAEPFSRSSVTWKDSFEWL